MSAVTNQTPEKSDQNLRVAKIDECDKGTKLNGRVTIFNRFLPNLTIMMKRLRQLMQNTLEWQLRSTWKINYCFCLGTCASLHGLSKWAKQPV